MSTPGRRVDGSRPARDLARQRDGSLTTNAVGAVLARMLVGTGDAMTFISVLWPIARRWRDRGSH